MHREGTCPMSVASVLSLMLSGVADQYHMQSEMRNGACKFELNSPLGRQADDIDVQPEFTRKRMDEQRLPTMNKHRSTIINFVQNKSAERK